MDRQLLLEMKEYIEEMEAFEGTMPQLYFKVLKALEEKKSFGDTHDYAMAKRLEKDHS